MREMGIFEGEELKVIRGHDPLVLQRYPAPSPELQGAVAMLHHTPEVEQ